MDREVTRHTSGQLQEAFGGYLLPYFINVMGLSRLETFDAIKSWLDKCNSVYRLDFNPKQKIDTALDRVGNYRPVSCDKLKEENNLLYVRLKAEGVIL